MLFASIWTWLLSRYPGAFSRKLQRLGGRAARIDVLAGPRRNASSSEAGGASVIPPAALTLARGRVRSRPDPYLTNAAITGGIALEMVERTNQMLLDRAKGREVVVDEAEVIERGWAGVSRGRQEP